MNPCESKNKKGQAVFYEEYPDAELYMKREPIQQVQHLLSTTKKKRVETGVPDFYRSEREYFTFTF